MNEALDATGSGKARRGGPSSRTAHGDEALLAEAVRPDAPIAPSATTGARLL